MHLSQMKYFITIAEHLSYTKAADKLGVSQPTLSRHIMLMEQELGTPLFTRTGREIRLTAAGTIMKVGLQKIYADYESLVTKARRVHEGYVGQLHVGILAGTYVGDFMPRVVEYMKENYPQLEVVFHSNTFDNLLEALYNKKMDLVFSLKFNIADREQILFDMVREAHDYIVFNKSHPLANKQDLSLRDFEEYTFVMISPEDNARSSQLIIDACKNAGFVPKVKYAPTIDDQMLWIEAGIGVTVLDDYNTLLMNPSIQRIPLKSHWSPATVIAWHQLNYNPAIPLFIKSVKKAVKALDERL